MEKGTKSLIASFVLAVTILLMSGIWSCGKRITSTTRTEIKNDSLRIEKSIELTQNTTWSDIGSVKPFNPLKPMLWQGKWYYNTVIEFDKSIEKGVVIKMDGTYIHTNSEELIKKKQTEKKDNANLYIGLSIVIGMLFVLYVTLKKYMP